MEIRVRETRIPGVGMRYDIELGRERGLFVVAETSGARHLGHVSSHDTPDWEITLSPDQAVAVAAILLGARFTLDTRGDVRTSADEVVVDTVELTTMSPLVGMTRAEIVLPGADAAVLAIISDRTPELVEDDATYRCRPLDHVVIAARAASIDETISFVRGPATAATNEPSR